MPIFEEQPDLLRRFRDGDRAAFEVLYKRYFADVYRLLCRGFTTGSPPCSVPALSEEQTLDHLQEIFLRAFDERARLGFDGLRPYRPYLLRIAKNYRIDVARHERHLVTDGSSRRAHTIDIDRVIDGALPIEPPDYEQELHLRSQLQQTQAFISTLSELERAFVTLRFAEEKSQQAVAVTMGI